MLLIIVGLIAGYVLGRVNLFSFFNSGGSIVTPIGTMVAPRPLDAFTIDNLAKREYKPGRIVLGEPVATESAYTQYIFRFISDGKTVTGLANIPSAGQAPYPVIVQFRGYIPRESFTSGEGTRRSGEYYATNGFITLAPDFLGFGGSDKPDADPFGERFETYTTGLNLLASIPSLPQADPKRIGVWGHSNGGHIALTVLEILGHASRHPLSGSSLPLVLWAPVSKPFPYSILAYTDETDDSGKELRKKLAEFEKTYDTDLYSLTNYLSYLSSPILLEQGDSDEEVPRWWSDEFVRHLKEYNIDVTYKVYPGADHNLNGAWNTAVSNDVEFIRTHLNR